jgi:hypothetical protein
MSSTFRPIRFLRSIVPVIRPIAANLLEGQPAANIEASEPGLFLKSTAGTLIKIGPVAVGEDAPNAIANGGTGQNTKGELWLDKSEEDGPTLKVHDGQSWVACFPVSYARALISETPPETSNLLEGTIWWNNETGIQFILYGSGVDGKWVQIGPSPTL